MVGRARQHMTHRLNRSRRCCWWRSLQSSRRRPNACMMLRRCPAQGDHSSTHHGRHAVVLHADLHVQRVLLRRDLIPCQRHQVLWHTCDTTRAQHCAVVSVTQEDATADRRM